MIGDRVHHRSAIVAALFASILMLALGVTHRALAARLGVHTRIIPIAQEALHRLPLQFGDWTGKDIPLDDAIVRGTETDAHVNRRYSRGNDGASVSLYVACGVRTSEIVYHQPSVCYPSAGWMPAGQEAVQLALDDDTTFPCSILRFVRGDLARESVTVLHYFLVDGQPYDHVSLFRSQVWRLLGATGYIAQVQIVASSATLTVDSSADLVSTFAKESAPFIVRLFENLGKTQAEDAPGELQEGQ